MPDTDPSVPQLRPVPAPGPAPAATVPENAVPTTERTGKTRTSRVSMVTRSHWERPAIQVHTIQSRHRVLGQGPPAKLQRRWYSGASRPSLFPNTTRLAITPLPGVQIAKIVQTSHTGAIGPFQLRQVSEQFTLFQRDASAAAPSSRCTGPAPTPARRCRRAPGLRPKPSSSPSPCSSRYCGW